MSDFRITFFFKDISGDQGWTESYYTSGTDPAQVMVSATLLSNARRGPLSDDYALEYIRVCDINPPRDAVFFEQGLVAGKGQAPGSASGKAATNVNSALNCRVFSSPGHWRSLLLRGCPADIAAVGMGAAVQTNARIRVNTYGDFLSAPAGVWKLRLITHGTAYGITAIDSPDGKRLSITLAAGATAPVAGDQIRVHLAAGMDHVNGLWRVKAVNALVVTTYPKILNVVGEYVANTGFLDKVTYGLSAITKLQPIRMTMRNTGRPSYVPAGKQKVQKS